MVQNYFLASPPGRENQLISIMTRKLNNDKKEVLTFVFTIFLNCTHIICIYIYINLSNFLQVLNTT